MNFSDLAASAQKPTDDKHDESNRERHSSGSHGSHRRSRTPSSRRTSRSPSRSEVHSPPRLNIMNFSDLAPSAQNPTESNHEKATSQERPRLADMSSKNEDACDGGAPQPVYDLSDLMPIAAPTQPQQDVKEDDDDEGAPRPVYDLSDLLSVAAPAQSEHRKSQVDDDGGAPQPVYDLSDLAPMAVPEQPLQRSSGGQRQDDLVAQIAELQKRLAAVEARGHASKDRASSGPSSGYPSERATEARQLPSPPQLWRAPEIFPGRSLSPPAAVPRTHDAVQRHLKPHAWDIASLGQDGHAIRQAWPAAQEPKVTEGSAARSSGSMAQAQPPIGRGLMPVGGGAAGFGGARGPVNPGTEAQVVERLAKRFLLERKAPVAERKERAAYQEMLQQVAWTALEPAAAQEIALLLSRRWLTPVSAAETLRAFRRCVHTILTDDRVLDIVEHQMAHHFQRVTGAQ